MYTHSMQTILRAQVAVGTFFMKSPVCRCLVMVRSLNRLGEGKGVKWQRGVGLHRNILIKYKKNKNKIQVTPQMDRSRYTGIGS